MTYLSEWPIEKIELARDRAASAAMVDIDTFLSALDEIERFTVNLARVTAERDAAYETMKNLQSYWMQALSQRDTAREAIADELVYLHALLDTLKGRSGWPFTQLAQSVEADIDVLSRSAPGSE